MSSLKQGFRRIKKRALGPLLALAARRLGIDYSLKTADRRVLEEDIFGKLLADAQCRRILFAGVEKYTCHYPRFFPGKAFNTIDWDKGKAHYGTPGRHRVGSVCELEKFYPPASFDAVLFNGLVGYGLNAADDVDRAFAAAHTVLAPGGLFILGWNNTPRHLSFALDALPAYGLFSPFTPALPGMSSHRVAVATDNGHTFDFLRRPATAAAS